MPTLFRWATKYTKQMRNQQQTTTTIGTNRWVNVNSRYQQPVAVCWLMRKCYINKCYAACLCSLLSSRLLNLITSCHIPVSQSHLSKRMKKVKDSSVYSGRNNNNLIIIRALFLFLAARIVMLQTMKRVASERWQLVRNLPERWRHYRPVYQAHCQQETSR